MKFLDLRSVLVVCVLSVVSGANSLAADFFDNAKVTPLLQQALAGAAGKTGTLAMVEYPPGGHTDQHRHPGADTFVYVIEGELEFQVAGKPAVKLGPGQTYYESPTDIHAVSRNASADKPARFLVMFVQDTGKPVLEPVH